MTLLMTAYLIIDAGGTFLKSGVLGQSGNVFEDSIFSIPSYSEGSKDQILRAFEKTMSNGINYMEKKNMVLHGIGIAFPGPFDIVHATPLMQHKFHSIYGINLRECFYEITGISRSIPIQFIHDANAVLLGELWNGNAQGFDNTAVVTLGTGLGFAISQKGKILCNKIGGPFLSIFKMPYKEGILEDYTAKRGFVRLYKELSGQCNDSITVLDIGQLAEKGDQAALQTFKKVGEILADALHGILCERKIECLLFCGQISRSFQFLEASLREGLKDVESLKRISVVKSIDYAAFFGVYRSMELSNTLIYSQIM
jgi:glucokinase